MEIVDCQAIPVEIEISPLTEDFGVSPYVTGYGAGTVTETTRLLVRLETADGTVGWGETTSIPSVSTALTIYEDDVFPELEGRDVSDIGSLPELFEYSYANFNSFQAGVEIAMWDAFGKSVELPIYELFGGKTRDSIPIAFCLGIHDTETTLDKVDTIREHGFTTLKTKGGNDWREDVERLIEIDEHVDGELDLRLDANQSWSFEDAVRVGATLEDAGVYVQYLEQPVRIDTFGTYKRLRERLAQPIGVNEDMYYQYNLSHLLKEDAIDVAVIDMIPAGGLQATREMATLASDSGISVVHHSSFDLGIKTAAVLQLMAATPSINLPPDRTNFTLEDDVIEQRHPVEDGAHPVPTGPGLGVTVDEGKVETYRVD